VELTTLTAWSSDCVPDDCTTSDGGAPVVTAGSSGAARGDAHPRVSSGRHASEGKRSMIEPETEERAWNGSKMPRTGMLREKSRGLAARFRPILDSRLPIPDS
jgi:hypothetical protein